MPELEYPEKVVWSPNPGPQAEFVACMEREVLYGGAAGGGKSEGLLASALRDTGNRYHRAILFRRSFPQLRALIDKAYQIYPTAGGVYREGPKEWRFPSGASIRFGYLETPADAYQYQGFEFNWMGFDELTQLPTDDAYIYLTGSRLRTLAASGLDEKIRAATNPGGNGHGWVRQRWNIPGDGSSTESWDSQTKSWRLFIRSNIKDNPHLAGTKYEENLNRLPSALRAALKEGRWDIVAGAKFSEFSHAVHTCDPFTIDPEWNVWRGADDGMNAPASILWFIKRDGIYYVIGELYRSGMIAEVMSEAVLKKDESITGRQSPNLTGSIDSSSFNDAGVGNQVGIGRAQVMNRLGCRWRPCEKTNTSRVAGANLIHSLQRIQPNGKPGLIIFKTCRNLIATLPTLPVDPNNIEDVDTDSDDHCFAAGTMVLTETGERPIEQVRPGDKVWTRFGLFPILLSGNTGTRPTFDVETECGILTATCNHRLWTKEGWKRVDGMTHCDHLFTWNSQKLFHQHIRNSEAQQSFITLIARPLLDVRPSGLRSVYNLTIAGPPEFFANGILAHNCYDALRYGLTYRPSTLNKMKITGI